jgi:hypothetical protein
MPRLPRQVKLITLASITPLSFFLFPFLCGFFNLSLASLMLLGPILLVGPIITAIAVVAMTAPPSKGSRVGVGVVAWFVTVALFFVFPAGAITWTLGFSTSFQLTKHPTQVQQWAVSVLKRYEEGQLNTSTNTRAHYWAVGKEELDASEVPAHINELWCDKPSIGIAEVTPEGHISSPTHDQPGEKKQNRCVAFSWYFAGILVGPPDFRCTWNPWYIREISPGVYAYCCMK